MFKMLNVSYEMHFDPIINQPTSFILTHEARVNTCVWANSARVDKLRTDHHQNGQMGSERSTWM